jgi:hypothetical protein
MYRLRLHLDSAGKRVADRRRQATRFTHGVIPAKPFRLISSRKPSALLRDARRFACVLASAVKVRKLPKTHELGTDLAPWELANEYAMLQSLISHLRVPVVQRPRTWPFQG